MLLERYYREYEGALMTSAEYCKLPERERGSTELTEGRLVFLLGVHYSKHDVITLNIGMALRVLVDARDLGRITLQQYEYDLTLPGEEGETVWHPDVAFVRKELLPIIDAADEQEMAPRLAPDFVVEIASKSQFRPKMRQHVRRYLAAGSRLCWLVWPKRREVEVWRPGDTEQPTAIKRVGDTLEGYSAVPGWTMTVAEVFARA
ncbi:MAG TPA: Uma2 family endonuclease [Ktedonobacterales bacterium]|jgi:Uma2 family endonuclease